MNKVPTVPWKRALNIVCVCVCMHVCVRHTDSLLIKEGRIRRPAQPGSYIHGVVTDDPDLIMI